MRLTASGMETRRSGGRNGKSMGEELAPRSHGDTEKAFNCIFSFLRFSPCLRVSVVKRFVTKITMNRDGGHGIETFVMAECLH
jgi:hypothetical protein